MTFILRTDKRAETYWECKLINGCVYERHHPNESAAGKPFRNMEETLEEYIRERQTWVFEVTSGNFEKFVKLHGIDIENN